MTDEERMQEKVDLYTDADSRAHYSQDELEANSPTIDEVLDWWGAKC